jgi:cell division protein FtsB
MQQQRAPRERATRGGPGQRGSGVRAEPRRLSGTRQGPVRLDPARAGARRAEPARSAARPAVARRGAGGAAASTKRTRAPQPRRLTGRATVLGLLLVGLLLAYAYPVRVYLSQQAEIAELEQQQAAQSRRIETLAEKRAKWDDPEYVKSQARSRLHYTLPGETPYIVLDGSAPTRQPAGGGPGTPADSRPWYGKLWASIRAADGPEPAG